MWLIFIVVVLVLTILMVFLIMAIRMLAAQAREQLNRYFLKNLETYDRLAQNKSRTVDQLDGELTALEEKVRAAKEQLEAMSRIREETGTAPKGQAGSAPFTGAPVETSPARYRDPDFLKDYAYVRRHMKLDAASLVQEVIGELDFTEDEELKAYRHMLELLSGQRLYDLAILPDQEQRAGLEGLLAPQEKELLEQFAREQGGFDLIRFRAYLKYYVESHESMAYVRCGNPEELASLESDRVQVLYDPGIHEGFKLSFKNNVYDFSL